MSIVFTGKTGYSCIRHVLCGVNLIFWILGACILSVGIWLNISYDTYARILPSYHVLSADNLAIVAGALMVIIGFFGCCGSWFQSKCLLVTYLSIIVVIMLLQITAGTLGYVFRGHIKATLRRELVDGIKYKYDANDTNGMASTWNKLQETFNCCGVDEYQDWYNISAWPSEQWVPESCCLPANTTESTDQSSETATCGRNPEVDAYRYRSHGCYNKFRHWIIEHLHIVGTTCIVFAFIQFFSIVSAALIVCTMDYKRRRPRAGSSRPTYNRVPTL
ncbi:Tetraspanin-9 [Halotydeus destructor]|nr:Tetraspanin-9 [Halotydeus destructor]